MTDRKTSWTGLVALLVVAAFLGSAAAQDPQTDHVCQADLTRPGMMSDVVSNTLTLGMGLPSRRVSVFLDGANTRFATGQEVLAAAAKHFAIEEAVLAANVEKFKHCNCRLGPMPDGSAAPGIARHTCEVDLAKTSDMRMVASNALLWGLRKPDAKVRSFLAGAEQRYPNGPELVKAAAKHFEVDEAVLAAEVERYRHCNCTMDRLPDGTPAPWSAEGMVERPADEEIEVSAFAKDVTLHVALHEIGHAVFREFDVPILSNEEAAADAFATYYLTTYMPDRAVEVLSARVTSLMIEAGETPEVDWKGEHDDDARRAFAIAALAVAADKEKYGPVAAIVGMSERDISRAVDYGGELRRSWRRVLAPLMMPEGTASNEAKVEYDQDNPFLRSACMEGLAGPVEKALRRFDWHSTVTVKFVDGPGKAGWSRGSRTVTVHSAYIQRFIEQGEKGLAGKK